MNCFFRNQHDALYNATKPYQYVGGEFLSYNKDWDTSSVRFAFVFPDKYEIGISNLGVRIIYDRVNSYKRETASEAINSKHIYPFLADRAYAPEPDFKPEFLYGVESKKALKDFDGIGFSLQYELSYPTVLKMLEMSGIGIKNCDRSENEPIVFAGGPCAFNPLPMSEFIDVFCIGDGEDMMVEVCEVLEWGKSNNKSRKEVIEELCKIEGCWSLQESVPLAPCGRDVGCEGSQESVPLAPCGRGVRGEGSKNINPSVYCKDNPSKQLLSAASYQYPRASHFYTRQALTYSKELRKKMTDAENILWYYLRNRQLNNMKFRRQEAIGNYIVDFVCYDKNLIIELDGGGHLEEPQIEHDTIRDKFLNEHGYRVLRIYNTDVFKNIEGVIDYILLNIEFPSHLNSLLQEADRNSFDPSPLTPLPQGARGTDSCEGSHSASLPQGARGTDSCEPSHSASLPQGAKGADFCISYNKEHNCATSHIGWRTVNKRISALTLENASTSYPIPFSSSVHDRAIVEIRRGCGRMCRFCQPGHVTLPIREREAEDIIKITKDLVNNTGYDEYSLLSLSSNDYGNIAEVIKELSVDFNKRKINVSLPSQRIDGFSLELANLMQSVRKSGMTLAPEAGSQRLRNVIKKNISEEQIVNAALTLYENGWNKLKFYFIAGLPTETTKDMDEMAELLSKIKYRAKQIKKEKELNYGFDITCTVSIFVPKPFTPFQWCGQTDLSIVSEHIRYLKEKTKHIKGLKINYHESSVSQIEAVLTRGDELLCDYIYALYKKGCYLDAWGEYFNKDIWKETAEECGFTLDKLAQKEYNLEENLPWDFVNVGLSKEWLQKEYEIAMMQGEEFNLQKTCEHNCVNCGVCTSLKTKKVIAKPYKASEEAQHVLDIKPIDPTRANVDPNIPVYRYRLKITKKGLLKYFSHLDWQNTFHKCLARTGLNIVYTLGFNPTMKVSMGIALPLFAESEGELVDIELYDNIDKNVLAELINSKLPDGAKVIDIKPVDRYTTAVDILAQWAEYKITPYIKNADTVSESDFVQQVQTLLSSPQILITKKNKKGQEKTVDYKKSVGSYRFEDNNLFIHLKVGQGSDIPALRADDLMKLVNPNQIYEITRIKFLDEKLNEM